jgi:hypothetical protein
MGGRSRSGFQVVSHGRRSRCEPRSAVPPNHPATIRGRASTRTTLCSDRSSGVFLGAALANTAPLPKALIPSRRPRHPRGDRVRRWWPATRSAHALPRGTGEGPAREPSDGRARVGRRATRLRDQPDHPRGRPSRCRNGREPAVSAGRGSLSQCARFASGEWAVEVAGSPARHLAGFHRTGDYGRAVASLACATTNGGRTVAVCSAAAASAISMRRRGAWHWVAWSAPSATAAPEPIAS